MYSRFQTLLVVLSILFVAACGDKKAEKSDAPEVKEETVAKEVAPDITGPEFSDDSVRNLYAGYLALSEALIASDEVKASSAAEQIKNISEENWNAIHSMASDLAASSDLDHQRTVFSALSAEVETIMKGNIVKGKIYKQFCPMAFNNTGGYWLSSSEDILNPYFGDRMLKCGKVDEIISSVE